MAQRRYSFGGVGVALRAPAELTEGAALAPFAVTEGAEDFMVDCVLSLNFPTPEEVPVHSRPYEVHWRTADGESGLHLWQRDADGPPQPYCLWRRRGGRIDVTWRAGLGDSLSAFQLLERVDLFHLLLLAGGVVLHGSYIVHNGTGMVFSAPSGTGKSTQAALWERFRGATVVNGDRCLLRMGPDGRPWVHGVCYSGTSNICNNISAPLRALVLLGQAPENRARPVRGMEAFRFLLPQCAYRTWDGGDVAAATDILSRVLSTAPAFRLDCRPDEGAVITLEKIL